MAEKDAPEDAPRTSEGPSLELPSFGFRRKKRRKDVSPAPTEPELATDEAPAASVHEAPAEPVEAQPAPLEPEPAAETEPEPAPPATAPPAEPAPRARRRPSLPRLGAVTAALVTGLVVGLVTVGLVVASQLGCEVVRGTSSCGKGGFFLLLAVLVAAGLLGGGILRAFGVPEGGSTSFLAMGLVAVVLMLVLGDQLFAWWMVLAVPAVAMAAYVASHRVTTAMVEPAGREMHR